MSKVWKRVTASPQWLVLGMLPKVSLPYTITAWVELAVGAVLPTAYLLAWSSLVGSIPAAARAGTGSPEAHAVLVRFVVVAALYVFQQAISPLFGTARSFFVRMIDQHIAERSMALVSDPPTVRHLEDPAQRDEIAEATGETTGGTVGSAVNALCGVWQMRLSGLLGGVVLLRFHWWVAVLMVGMPIALLRYWQGWYRSTTQAVFDRGQSLRRARYTMFLGTGHEAAGEIRVFGLRRHLGERMFTSWSEAMVEVWATWRAGRVRLAVALAIPALAMFGVVALLGIEASRGDVSLTLAVAVLGALTVVSHVGSVSDNDYLVQQGLAGLPKLLELEARLAPDPAAASLPVPADAPTREIRFEGVTFGYPGRDSLVYDGLDLVLPAHRSTAVVGVNGAGKTTLVKLLAGLWPPDAGRITVDGTDIADLEPAAWQRKVAAIFQGFQKYRLSASDNIAYGAPEHAGDEAMIRAAAERAGIADVLDALPSGFATPLDRQIEGGAEISGGEWQRLALARALFACAAGATVLVLDEPTASLDVRTEAALYERFLDLTSGVTTLVISHRFSTVRRADHIVVIDDGKVIERGTHDELVAAGGHYAEMFLLQAGRYDDLDGEGEEVVADA
jgi:ATP-binding cassette subfamily B protein